MFHFNHCKLCSCLLEVGKVFGYMVKYKYHDGLLKIKTPRAGDI